LPKWALKLLTTKAEIVNPYRIFFYQLLLLLSSAPRRRLKLWVRFEVSYPASSMYDCRPYIRGGTRTSAMEAPRRSKRPEERERELTPSVEWRRTSEEKWENHWMHMDVWDWSPEMSSNKIHTSPNPWIIVGSKPDITAKSDRGQCTAGCIHSPRIMLPLAVITWVSLSGWYHTRQWFGDCHYEVRPVPDTEYIVLIDGLVASTQLVVFIFQLFVDIFYHYI
jgi:hypothetical protein